MRLRTIGRKRRPQPAVGGGAGIFERLRRQGREEYGDGGGRKVEAKRLAGAAGPRQDVMATRIAQPFAAERHAHDVHGLAQAGQGRAVGRAVQPLDDLGAAGAEPQDEAPARKFMKRQRRHRGHRRRAGADLHDAAAQRDALGARGEKGERSRGVARPGLRRPGEGNAHPFGPGDDLRRGGEVPPVVAADGDPDFHGAPLSLRSEYPAPAGRARIMTRRANR